MLAKINSALEPLLGADKFRATAAVECDFTSAEQSDENFDPSKSVMVTSQKTEDISGGPVAAGVPGTASSLPRPTSKPVTGSNGVTRRTENITYQSSHTVRHVRVPEGTIKHMSVSLLVDSDVRWEGTGDKAKRIVQPPTPEKLKSIHDLVAGVIGFSAERGDQLVVESLPFESTVNPEPVSLAPKAAPVVPASPLDQLLKNKYVMIGGGVGVLVLLGLVIVAIKYARPEGRRGCGHGWPANGRQRRRSDRSGEADRGYAGRTGGAPSEAGERRVERSEVTAGNQESRGANQAHWGTGQERHDSNGPCSEGMDERSEELGNG